jgi:hypothetical protein
MLGPRLIASMLFYFQLNSLLVFPRCSEELTATAVFKPFPMRVHKVSFLFVQTFIGSKLDISSTDRVVETRERVAGIASLGMRARRLRIVGHSSGSATSEEQGFTRQTRRLQSEPKNSPIGQEMTEIWSKQYLDHISVISCPIGLFLGSFWSLRVWWVNPCSSLSATQ